MRVMGTYLANQKREEAQQQRRCILPILRAPTMQRDSLYVEAYLVLPTVCTLKRQRDGFKTIRSDQRRPVSSHRV